MGMEELPWTGERLVPTLAGGIACEHLHRYAMARDAVAGKDVLDIACGEGYGSALLAQTARSVTGVDVDPKAVAHAEAKYGGANARFLHGECVAIPVGDASVDVVVSFETIEHISEHEIFLSEIRRVLRPGGLVLISTPERENYDTTQTTANPFHVREMSGEEFHALLKNRFAHVALLSQRYLSSSVILPEAAEVKVSAGMFSGNYSAVDFSGRLRTPVYFIAAASDAALPSLKAGVFELVDGPGSAPFVPNLQVFGDTGAGYDEALSVRCALAGGNWQTLRIGNLQSLHRCPDRMLRIDPLNTKGMIVIASIRIIRDADGAPLHVADSEAEFGKIQCNDALIPCWHEGHLNLVSMGFDPQIYLPPFGDLGPDSCTLEIKLKFELGGTPTHPSAQMPAGEDADDPAIRGLRSVVSWTAKQNETALRVIRSAEEWQRRSWFRRAFRRWKSPRAEAGQIGLFPPSTLAQNERGTDAGSEKPGANALPKFLTAGRESAVRIAAKWGLTPHLRQLEHDARILRKAKLVLGPWYCAQHPEVGLRPGDATLHFLRIGAALGWNPNPWFDTAWYLDQNPDVAATGVNPAIHYAEKGWREGRDPHPEFRIEKYLEANPDVKRAGAEPLAHYLCDGIREKRPLEPPCLITEPPRDFAVPFSKEPENFSGWPQPDVRLLAFFLPQFHAIPENDRWWGEGFTEWVNVKRAQPQADWHYQPHVPHADLGCYNLEDPAVMERQVAMARHFGIHGFCFYHYWFAGKRLLEMPVDRLLATGKPDFPFCLCWANENWTRRWDGLDAEILIAQEHSAEDDVAFIRSILPALRDRRYIRTGGRPLLLVYRPLLLPDPAATFLRWREVCRKEGVGEIHLAGVLGANFLDPRPLGLDSAVEFPPNSSAFGTIEGVAQWMSPKFEGMCCDYVQSLSCAMKQPAAEFPTFRTVMPAWDNSARRGDRAVIFGNSNPSHYFRWLRFVIDQTRRQKNGDERIAFVNAWNEWAEGCHLEPDSKYGYQSLNATRAALLPPTAHFAEPILVIGADAGGADAREHLLPLLREWKKDRRFPFCLILLGGGPLRAEFEACCPTLVLADAPGPEKEKAALDIFLVKPPRLVFARTIVGGVLLKELNRFAASIVTEADTLTKSIEHGTHASVSVTESDRPLVTVILPNYNHAPFLKQRLDSILAQGIGDLEILLLDDASTDESRTILEAFAATQPRARLIFNTANSGSTFKQWRKALGLARGQFVWIAESDDSAEPGLLAALLHKLRRQPDAAFAYAQSRMIDDTDRSLGLPIEWTADISATRWLIDFAGPGREEIREVLAIKNSIPNASAVLFRNFNGIADLVDDTMRLCADWLFWVRLCRRGGIAFDARPLNRWRQRTSNARTRPPGEIEWEEGSRVIAECAQAIAAVPEDESKMLSSFRARCEAWTKAALQTS